MKLGMRLCISLFCMVLSFANVLYSQEWKNATYHQEYVVEFASEEDAQNAQFAVLPLPVGKSMALTSRWDDTNWKHVDMARTLSENGWKGSFLLNKVEGDFQKYAVPKLLATGCDVGVHTCSHPHLETLAPNTVFREILENRVKIETACDICATAFTFPFGIHETEKPEQLATSADQGQVLLRSGLLGGGEFVDIADHMGLEPLQFIAPNLFRANDRDPNEAEFTKGWNHAMEQIQHGVGGRCACLGVHSWQDSNHKDGFQRLSKLLATKANNPEIWYCSMQEYMAYTLDAQNSARIAEVDGKSVLVSVNRIFPAEVGTALNLDVQISPAPVKVSSCCDDGTTVEIPCAEGTVSLPHTSGVMGVPTKIGLVVNSVCEKFPGLVFSSDVNLEKNIVVLRVENHTGALLENVRCQVRLPLYWQDGVKVAAFSLDKDQVKTVEIPLGEINPAPKYAVGAFFVVTQFDFTTSECAGRAYITQTLDNSGNVSKLGK